MHGDDDRIVPIAISGARTAQMVKGARYVVVKGGPHGMSWTHADQVSAELVNFLA
jgi:pimeloyl-ACP methyl ester carboxylesterase